MSRWYIPLITGLIFWVSAAAGLSNTLSRVYGPPITGTSGLPTPSPTYDPLRVPELPENPSEAELGEYLYYFHCMPCHGDLGQGLTDEFRAVWVEDHQNCWGRGCHGGRPMDEGFPIPTIVPRVIAEEDALMHFTRFDALLTYLRDTHPPQYPGKLEDDEYRAMTVFLWQENQKPESVKASATPFPPTGTGEVLSVSTSTKTAALIILTPVPVETELPADTIRPEDTKRPEAGLNALWVVVGLAAGSLLVFSLTRLAHRQNNHQDRS